MLSFSTERKGKTVNSAKLQNYKKCGTYGKKNGKSTILDILLNSNVILRLRTLESFIWILRLDTLYTVWRMGGMSMGKVALQFRFPSFTLRHMAGKGCA